MELTIVAILAHLVQKTAWHGQFFAPPLAALCPFQGKYRHSEVPVGSSLTANVQALKADGKNASFGKPLSTSSKSSIGKDKVERYATEKAVVHSFSYTISNNANAEGEYVY